jgi:glutamyl-tRNA synthetase
VRFRCPDVGSTIVHDLIKGNISFNNEELDDLIIERSDGYPTYNFAVVVDDADMGITHVIRGDDHVNNTPRQILLYKALNYDVPQVGHVPMILGADKARLSKRHGATSVMAYRDMGFLPEALVNYLVRLGWSHGDQEIFRIEELIELFSLESIGKSAAVFNPDKLLWLNQHYLKDRPVEQLVQEMVPFWEKMHVDATDSHFIRKVVNDLKTRVKTLAELAEAGIFYFSEDFPYQHDAAEKFLTGDNAGHLETIMNQLSSLNDYSREGIEGFLKHIAEQRNTKLKMIAQPLRIALTGKTVSPGLDEIMITLGKDRVTKRIKRAIGYIERSK